MFQRNDIVLFLPLSSSVKVIPPLALHGTTFLSLNLNLEMNDSKKSTVEGRRKPKGISLNNLTGGKHFPAHTKIRNGNTFKKDVMAPVPVLVRLDKELFINN